MSSGYIPQALWVPFVFALLLCDLPWVLVVAAAQLVGLFLLHGADMRVFPASIILAWALGCTLFTFRWLIQRSLALAEREPVRFLFLAFHDPLTELPNRRLLGDRAGEAITQAKRSGLLVGMIFVDLDHFAHINDSLGHEAGDHLLREVAVRLNGAVRETDTVCRFGGDEFVVLLPELPSVAVVERVAQDMLRRLSEPFSLQDLSFRVTGSFGVACFPNDGETPDDLLKSADWLCARVDAECAARNLPHKRVFVGGFSQGAVVAMLAALRHKEALGGAVMLSGWAPMRGKLSGMAADGGARTVPLFYGHGQADQTVAFALAQESMHCVNEKCGFDVTWKTYPGLGHGAANQEFRDLAAWLREQLRG